MYFRTLCTPHADDKYYPMPFTTPNVQWWLLLAAVVVLVAGPCIGRGGQDKKERNQISQRNQRNRKKKGTDHPVMD